MKAIKQITALLNRYLVMRDTESTAKKLKEGTRDQLLNLLPPNTANEWLIAGWGKVTYHRPKDSLTVDLERLELEYPKAYKACVSEQPNAPRFCVYPEKDAIVAAFKDKVIHGQATVSLEG